MAEFAAHGYEGSSTEEIARRAGIAQPYVFRLFGTKRTSSTPPSSAACLS
jgi:AcrR family transcriptional regulator